MTTEAIQPAVEDKPSVAPTAAPAPGSESDKASESFLLSFKSREEAEKGYKEVQGAKTRAEQRAAELERQAADRKQELALLRESVDALKATTEATKPDPKAADQKRLADWRQAKIDSGVDEAVVDAMLEVQGDLAYELTQRQKQELQQEREKLEAELAAVRSQIADSRPDYLARKEQIDKVMTDYGITDRDKAIALDKEMQAARGEEPPPSAPPGTTGASRVPGEPPTDWIGAEERASYRQRGYTDAEIDEVNAKKRKEANASH